MVVAELVEVIAVEVMAVAVIIWSHNCSQNFPRVSRGHPSGRSPRRLGITMMLVCQVPRDEREYKTVQGYIRKTLNFAYRVFMEWTKSLKLWSSGRLHKLFFVTTLDKDEAIAISYYFLR